MYSAEQVNTACFLCGFIDNITIAESKDIIG